MEDHRVILAHAPLILANLLFGSLAVPITIRIVTPGNPLIRPPPRQEVGVLGVVHQVGAAEWDSPTLYLLPSAMTSSKHLFGKADLTLEKQALSHIAQRDLQVEDGIISLGVGSHQGSNDVHGLTQERFGLQRVPRKVEEISAVLECSPKGPLGECRVEAIFRYNAKCDVHSLPLGS